jgi:hypothetical protein
VGLQLIHRIAARVATNDLPQLWNSCQRPRLDEKEYGRKQTFLECAMEGDSHWKLSHKHFQPTGWLWKSGQDSELRGGNEVMNVYRCHPVPKGMLVGAATMRQ